MRCGVEEGVAQSPGAGDEPASAGLSNVDAGGRRVRRTTRRGGRLSPRYGGDPRGVRQAGTLR